MFDISFPYFYFVRMLKRYFISNISLMVLLNFLVKPIWVFGIDRNVQNAVGNEDYGLYGALLSLTIIFNILLDLGITNFNNKSLAEDTSRIKDYLPSMLVAKATLSFLFMIVIMLAAVLFGYTGYSLHLLSLIALIQLLNSFLLYLRSNVSAHHDFKIDSVLSISDKLIMILICGVLLFTPSFKAQFKIEWFIYAQLAAYALSIFGALFVIFFKYKRPDFSLVKIDLIKKILKQSLPYAALILLMGIYMRFDTVLLERLLGEEGKREAGVYLTAFRILDALNMFGFLFAGMLLPMFSRMLIKKNRVKELVQTTANILLPVSLVIAAHAIFFSAEIMNELYVKNTSIGSQLYTMVMLAFPAYCLMYIYSTLLTAQGNLKLLNGIAITACVISISLNVVFIPQYKTFSVAAVAILVHWFAAACYIFYCIKKTDITLRLGWVGQFVLFFIAFVGINYGLQFFIKNYIISILLNIVLFVPLVFLFKFWKWGDITKYFQEIVVKDK